MADEQLRGTERYLDEVEQEPPPRWRLALSSSFCLLTLAALIIGGKLFLFPDLSVRSFAIRLAIGAAAVVALWLAFFRKRLT